MNLITRLPAPGSLPSCCCWRHLLGSLVSPLRVHVLVCFCLGYGYMDWRELWVAFRSLYPYSPPSAPTLYKAWHDAFYLCNGTEVEKYPSHELLSGNRRCNFIWRQGRPERWTKDLKMKRFPWWFSTLSQMSLQQEHCRRGHMQKNQYYDMRGKRLEAEEWP